VVALVVISEAEKRRRVLAAILRRMDLWVGWWRLKEPMNRTYLSMRIIGLAAATLAVFVTAAAAAAPGPHRALCPQCFGLAAIGDDIFTDDPGRADEFRQMIALARERDAAFFGSQLKARPRLITCTTRRCDVAFGGGTNAKGTTYGDLLIRFGPLRLVESIFAHELVHAELAHRSGWPYRRFPAWFNEGLAVYVSEDTRYPGEADEADVAWIEGAITPEDWLRFIGKSTHAYEAARTAVGEIADQVGLAGLRELIAEVASGASFDRALADAEASTSSRADKATTAG
jgi:hypothetical protein